ncbi:MAG TPA: efflux RND transporter periplasmic adaptor subunit, partial [Kribbellaceae bacterium]|nr:efflux RND transporter periplasmic adaptor subunit [Kribbellaceae bacterium]
TDSPAASSAAQLAADQAAIDQAEADLLQARTERAQARVVAPISGRVASVDVEPGDSVAAADAAAVIVNGSGVVVETSVPETRIRQVRVGQTVHVTPLGSTTAAAGTVTAISLGADTSSGTASYAVTVSVPDPDVSLPTGSEAELEIVTGSADDVVTVPASAVTRAGDAATVRVLGSDGMLTLKPVTLGLVGSRTAEIASGLAAGDRVVLAVLDQEVTGASTQTGMGGPMRVGPVDGTMGGPMQGGPPVVQQG